MNPALGGSSRRACRPQQQVQARSRMCPYARAQVVGTGFGHRAHRRRSTVDQAGRVLELTVKPKGIGGSDEIFLTDPFSRPPHPGKHQQDHSSPSTLASLPGLPARPGSCTKPGVAKPPWHPIRLQATYVLSYLKAPTRQGSQFH